MATLLPWEMPGGLPMKISNLLFATDFSETAAGARALAMALASEKGARLHLVHVVPTLMDPGSATSRLQAEALTLGQEGCAVETAVLGGSAAAAIVRYARANAIDLIVIGTHGRTGMSRVLLGSVAEAVLRLAPCPVLAVPLARVAAGTAGPPTAGATADAPLPYCISCATPSEELICAACRDRIRGEAVAAKRSVEKAGRRGQPA
jgi:nucleotide-binding universal stress UspA family protein